MTKEALERLLKLVPLKQEDAEKIIRAESSPTPPPNLSPVPPLPPLPDRYPQISTLEYLTSGITIYIRNYISSFFTKGVSMSTDLKTNIIAAFVAVATLLQGVFHWTLSVDTLTTIAGVLATIIFFFIGKSSTTPTSSVKS